jgi:hypothetical protein
MRSFDFGGFFGSLLSEIQMSLLPISEMTYGGKIMAVTMYFGEQHQNYSLVKRSRGNKTPQLEFVVQPSCRLFLRLARQNCRFVSRKSLSAMQVENLT